jgi:site-specific DNA recombinase
MKRLNCAIYTRKSSDEGLEKEFNSLDAQREACAAFVLSQKHAGWAALPDLYDDGGLSGGTMERPALQQLLGDIKAGKVQIIVVYKVDRLTRSLADFAKIFDVFDAHGASFVSVTQQFNTTTSMGRLTRSSSVRLQASAFATRLRHPRPRACGWAAMSRSATTSKSAS